MLNPLYHGFTQPTVDEKVYAKLSARMKDRFDIFGTLPNVIDDDWIEDEERFEAQLRDYTDRRARANAFGLRYAGIDGAGYRLTGSLQHLVTASIRRGDEHGAEHLSNTFHFGCSIEKPAERNAGRAVECVGAYVLRNHPNTQLIDVVKLSSNYPGQSKRGQTNCLCKAWPNE